MNRGIGGVGVSRAVGWWVATRPGGEQPQGRTPTQKAGQHNGSFGRSAGLEGFAPKNVADGMESVDFGSFEMIHSSIKKFGTFGAQKIRQDVLEKQLAILTPPPEAGTYRLANTTDLTPFYGYSLANTRDSPLPYWRTLN